MARKRMIDPSVWQDEGMADLTPRQQLLYIGLISNADDDGRLKGTPAAIRLMLPIVYPGTPLDEIELDLLCVLSAMSKLIRYEHEGRAYLVFLNYRRWQNINRPTPSALPAPPAAMLPASGEEETADRADDVDAGESVSDQGALTQAGAGGMSPHGALIPTPEPTHEGSVRTHGALSEDSVRTHPQVKLREEKLREQKGREGGTGDAPAARQPAPPRPPASPPPAATASAESSEPRSKRARRLPDDFPLTAEMRDWLAEKRPDLNPDLAHEEFCTYWRGSGGVKADWLQTWRNGMLKARPLPQPRAAPGLNGVAALVGAPAARATADPATDQPRRTARNIEVLRRAF